MIGRCLTRHDRAEARCEDGQVAFHYQIPKRYSDLDADGLVDQGVVIDYLQEARTDFLLSAEDPMPAMLGSGVLVTGHQVEYLAPIRADAAVVDAEVWVDRVGGSRFSASYLLRDAGRPAVQARTFLAPYDLEAASLRRLTAVERERLSRVSGPPVEMASLGRVGRTDLDHAQHTPCRVRWADMDSYRHVNNVRFADYFHQARLELLASAGPPPSGTSWRALRQDIDYRLPIDFRREPYQVRTAVTGIADDTCALVADIVDPCATELRSFATTRSVLAVTDTAGRRLPLPAGIREALEEWRS